MNTGPFYVSSLDLGSTHAKAAVCLVQAGRVSILGQGISAVRRRGALDGRIEHSLRGSVDAGRRHD